MIMGIGLFKDRKKEKAFVKALDNIFVDKRKQKYGLWKKTLNERYLVHFYHPKKERILRLEAVFKDYETRYSKPKWRIIYGKSTKGRLVKDYLKSKTEALKHAYNFMKVNP